VTLGECEKSFVLVKEKRLAWFFQPQTSLCDIGALPVTHIGTLTPWLPRTYGPYQHHTHVYGGHQTSHVPDRRNNSVCTCYGRVSLLLLWLGGAGFKVAWATAARSYSPRSARAPSRAAWQVWMPGTARKPRHHTLRYTQHLAVLSTSNPTKPPLQNTGAQPSSAPLGPAQSLTSAGSTKRQASKHDA